MGAASSAEAEKEYFSNRSRHLSRSFHAFDPMGEADLRKADELDAICEQAGAYQTTRPVPRRNSSPRDGRALG
jgi:hypothetical protein